MCQCLWRHCKNRCSSNISLEGYFEREETEDEYLNSVLLLLLLLFIFKIFHVSLSHLAQKIILPTLVNWDKCLSWFEKILYAYLFYLDFCHKNLDRTDMRINMPSLILQSGKLFTIILFLLQLKQYLYQLIRNMCCQKSAFPFLIDYSIHDHFSPC